VKLISDADRVAGNYRAELSNSGENYRAGLANTGANYRANLANSGENYRANIGANSAWNLGNLRYGNQGQPVSFPQSTPYQGRSLPSFNQVFGTPAYPYNPVGGEGVPWGTTSGMNESGNPVYNDPGYNPDDPYGYGNYGF
jgi:hypothetical protein